MNHVLHSVREYYQDLNKDQSARWNRKESFKLRLNYTESEYAMTGDHQDIVCEY